MNDWTSEKFDFEDMQPDRISILINSIYGVCDVVLYQGTVKKSLGMDDPYCVPELDNINETTLNLPLETPLVGFHGMVDSFGIVSLGLILVDTLD